MLNEIKLAHSLHPRVRGARQAMSASFLSFCYSKIICVRVHEEVGAWVEPINVVSVLVGADADKIEDRTLAGKHALHKCEFMS
jgi:hypothetical protein